MRLLRAFIAHEAATQLRSMRFRIIVAAYLLMPSVALLLVLASSRAGASHIGVGAYADGLAVVLPALTAWCVAMVAVDGITRERDESSFAVVSLFDVSASGYVVRRWIAVVVVFLPLTLFPLVIGAAFAAFSLHLFSHPTALLSAFFWTWLFYAVPSLVIVSATMLALGTITGRSVLAILGFAAIMSVGIGGLQDLLAIDHHHLDRPLELLLIDGQKLQRLEWAARGYARVTSPTDAGYPVVRELDALVPKAALLASIAVLLLGIAPAYLRRTRPDIRPWRIPPTHPLRTFLGFLNRSRESLMPDSGRQRIDVIVGCLALLVSAIFFGVLLGRETHFIRLARARHNADVAIEPRAMSESITPVSMHIEGTVGRRVISTRSTLVVRNEGGRPESHLAFTLHPALRLRVDGRRSTLMRRWDRVGIDVDPPIAPGATCTLKFDVEGAPDDVDFAWGGNFAEQYRRWERATQSVELSDLSRTHIIPAVTGTEIDLQGSDLVPVPRYTPWTLAESGDVDTGVTSFARESIRPESALSIILRIGEELTAGDSCGSISAGGAIQSRCRFPLSDYRIRGAPFKLMPISTRAKLLYLESHEELARRQAPLIAEALDSAVSAWPRLSLSKATLFVENPNDPESLQPRMFSAAPLGTSGSLFFIPEWVITRRQPIESGPLAAAIAARALTQRRVVPRRENEFFIGFFERVVTARLNAGRQNALLPVHGNLRVAPLIGAKANRWDSRLKLLLVDLENRVGADRVADGINDFLGKKGTGSAKELFESIAARSGISLDRFYDDFIVGAATPRLTLDGVAARRHGDLWMVTGSLRNVGTGEVFCPIVLRTEGGTLRRTLRISGGESIPIELSTASKPRTLQLDPSGVCYRQPMIGLVENVELREDS